MVEEVLAGSSHENTVRRVKKAEENVRMPILEFCKNVKDGTPFLDTPQNLRKVDWILAAVSNLELNVRGEYLRISVVIYYRFRFSNLVVYDIKVQINNYFKLKSIFIYLREIMTEIFFIK